MATNIKRELERETKAEIEDELKLEENCEDIKAISSTLYPDVMVIDDTPPASPAPCARSLTAAEIFDNDATSYNNTTRICSTCHKPHPPEYYLAAHTGPWADRCTRCIECRIINNLEETVTIREKSPVKSVLIDEATKRWKSWVDVLPSKGFRVDAAWRESVGNKVLESLANYISSNLKDFKQMHKHHQAMKPFLKARAAKKAAVGKHTGRSRAKRASPAAQKATKPAVTATTEARLTPEALPSSNIFGPLSSQVRVSQPVQAAVPAVPAAVPSFIQTRPARSVHPATAGLAEKIDRLAKEGVSLATPSPTPSAAPAGKIKPPSLLHELDPYATIDTGLNHIKTTLQAVAKEMKYRYFLNVKNHWFKGVKEVNGQLEDMRYEPEEEERCDEVLTGIGEAVGLGKGGKVAKPTGRPRNGTQGSVGTIRVA